MAPRFLISIGKYMQVTKPSFKVSQFVAQSSKRQRHVEGNGGGLCKTTLIKVLSSSSYHLNSLSIKLVQAFLNFLRYISSLYFNISSVLHQEHCFLAIFNQPTASTLQLTHFSVCVFLPSIVFNGRHHEGSTTTI